MATLAPKRPNGKAVAVAPVSNAAADFIGMEQPYTASVTVEGTAALLFHAYNVESVAEKAGAAKGSKAKKTDDLESYVYRTPEGLLGIPGLNFCASLALAAKFVQDPRSPRKSALDLVKASVVPLGDIAALEPATATWDSIDIRRVVVQRSAISRQRPCMRAGWRVTFQLLITAPEYVTVPFLRSLVQRAGKFTGLGDFRPSFGRFDVVRFDVSEVSA